MRWSILLSTLLSTSAAVLIGVSANPAIAQQTESANKPADTATQANDADSTPKSASEVETEPADEQTKSEPQKDTPPVARGRPNDTFIPSEEISEDEPVSFPVDI